MGGGEEISTSAETRWGAIAATRSATAPPKELPTTAARSIPGFVERLEHVVPRRLRPSSTAASPKPGRSTASTR